MRIPLVIPQESLTRKVARPCVSVDEYIACLEQVERASRFAERVPVERRNQLPSIRRFLTLERSAPPTHRGSRA